MLRSSHLNYLFNRQTLVFQCEGSNRKAWPIVMLRNIFVTNRAALSSEVFGWPSLVLYTH